MSPGIVEQDEQFEDCSLEPIAICGMACRLPGGVDSDSSFWQMLVEKRSGQTPKVPKSRFNIDAHYHENLARPGSFNVAGGYFLDGNPLDFDPTFFNMTPIEAQWLDPQQRKMLEISYECLVSAGVTLETISGSNTAVFVGSFTSDFQQMTVLEGDFRHSYTATGVDPGIISNRIGNVFNLHGPSFTINTACSSSIYALHNACHALRSRDCDAAIVGGVNLILTVDQHMNTAKLGILSPTSTCHTFDASADGYGRAEGVGALFVKRLSDAIRDGDPIRAVVRATAVNTNGKVEGMGITHPSVEGQERVVRLAYQKANLDPNETAYAELHGTGTPVGDPIEVRAISRALNDTRPTDRPLLIGAVKPNIGHSEAASGIFAVMKAALMTESSTIPGVPYFQRLNPNIKEKEWNIKVHNNTAPWPDTDIRRASVSSFGYGGTNGHVIVESIDTLYPRYQHAKKKTKADKNANAPKTPFLLCFSAHDKPTLMRNIAVTGAVAHQYHLTDLAYTLNMRRSKLAQRAYVVARAGRECEAFALATSQAGTASRKRASIGFLFTGQGAQWAGMGKVAVQEFPVVQDTLQKLDRILSKLTPKPSFRILDLLLHDTESNAERINAADVSQPLCTAIQIALVDLFAQWNITPEVSIGHSSGEIGAAYAAGLISAPEAILAAFCRGRAVAENSPSGSMLAVGLGAQEVEEYLSSIAPEDVCIACENSPSSVTLSGREGPISQLKTVLTEKGIFARELPTGRAYHSPHMAAVGIAYENMLSAALKEIPEDDLLWRCPRSSMISSVTAEPIDFSLKTLSADYWSANLRNRVLFNTAVQQLGTNKEFDTITHLIEIGPHSALSGPFKQICQGDKPLGSRITYIPSLKRHENDSERLLAVAGSLFVAGYAVDLEEVNTSGGIKTGGFQDNQKTRNLLVDLPPYQWNYERSYWSEPRTSAENRTRVYPRHDLLGTRVSGLSAKAASWRNVLRHRDVPWLKDHCLGGTAIFPAAGHISMAVEALRQISETEESPFQGVQLRDIDIKTALVVPEDDDGTEVILNLQSPTEPTSTWYTFSVESPGEDGEWTVHCIGRISAINSSTVAPSSTRVPVDESALTQRVSGRRWYEAFHRIGFYYGKTFQQMLHARSARTLHHAAGDVNVREWCSEEMQAESRYLVHPSTIDACLHLVIISANAGNHKEMPWGVVPTRIEEICLYPARVGLEVTVGHAVAWTDSFEGRRCITNVRLNGADDRLLLDIKNLACTSYEAARPARLEEEEGKELRGPEPFSVMSWKPDIATLRKDDAGKLWPDVMCSQENIFAQCVELIAHRQNISKALVIEQAVDAKTQSFVDSVLKVVPNITVSIGVPANKSGEDKVNASDLAHTQTVQLGADPETWGVDSNGPHDVVIMSSDMGSHGVQHLESLLKLVSNDGWLICPSIMMSSSESPQAALFQLGTHSVVRKVAMTTNNHSLEPTPKREIAVLSAPQDQGLQNVRDTFSSLRSQYIVQEKTITGFVPTEEYGVVFDDTTGAISTSILENENDFNTIKAVLTSGVSVLWLTRGVRQGCPVGHQGVTGMAEGLLRVLRSEQIAVKVTLLDLDADAEPEDVSYAIVHSLGSMCTKDSGCDVEFWLRRGLIFISRVQGHDRINQDFRQNEPHKVPLSGPLRLVSKTEDAQFVFEPQGRDESTSLADDQIMIQVSASSWPSYAPGSRTLVVGTVVQAGASVDPGLVGRRSIAFVYDNFQTVTTTSAYAMIGGEFQEVSSESLVHAISLLYPLVNLCFIQAKLEKGDTVISLPGPEQDMKMLVKLATAMDWRLTVITTPDDNGDVDTTNIGLDDIQVISASDVNEMISSIADQRKFSSSGTVTILAHDFDSKITQEAWRHIPPSCRFLLLNEKPLETGLDPLPFSRSATFIPSSMKYVRESANSISSLLSLSLGLTDEHPALLATEASQDGVQVVDIEDARQLTVNNNKNSGNPDTVVRYRPETSQILASVQTKQLQLSSDATYLLVGCLGGLGRSLTRWMMGYGARHFAFISRSGADKPEAARLIEDIQKLGASTQVLRADASDEEAVAKIVASLQEERPIRGVVHAAMVLKDGMFEQMTHESFVDCVKPKAHGALSLHKALQSGNIDLDFFVMTSSISALLGNTGQSNYSAANSALDTLARRRRAAGLAATSLVLPMVLDVGVVAGNDSIETSLVRKGLYGIDEQEMLRGFEAAMLNSRPGCGTTTDSLTSSSKDITFRIADESQIIMGMEPRELAASCVDESRDAFWHGDARFYHTLADMERIISGNNSDKSGKQDENSIFSQTLKNAVSGGHEAVVRVISEHIARKLSSILMIPLDDFEVDGSASIASYGLDSMIGAEFRTWLFKEFGLDFPFQKLLASTLTFKTLSAAVIEKMGLLNS